MDIASILGAALGTIIVLVVMMLSGSLIMYWDLMSLAIVIGGAVCATMMSWPLKTFLGAVEVGLGAFFNKLEPPEDIIDKIEELATMARKESLLALERIEVSNVFLAKGIRLAIDGTDPEQLATMLSEDVEVLKRSLKDGRGVFEDLGEMAPAFGMIGTVIGLIVIMANLTDVSKIGPGLAVALITTLYGALVANMLFVPIAKKLKYRGTEQVRNYEMIKIGIASILNGDNPRLIRARLEAFCEN